MVDQTKLTDMFVDISRQSIKTGFQTMDNLQRQTEKVMDLTLNNMTILQDETKKTYETIMDNVKKSRSSIVDAVDEGLSTFERQFTGKKSESVKTK